VRRLTGDPAAAAIVRAVIALGHAMGVRTNAEGVETREEARVLLREGCEEGQGYLYGHPMPGADFLALLEGQAQPRRIGGMHALRLS
jgi:EAL domain-containing protein (putative c-di-GMP-specific phosphodiesterase class I)